MKAYLINNITEQLRALNKVDCDECITPEYMASLFEDYHHPFKERFI